MKGQCPLCPYFGPLTEDHIIPQKFFRILEQYNICPKSLKDHPDNLQWLCAYCNKRKGLKIPNDNKYAIKLKLQLYDRVATNGIYLPARTIRTIARMFDPY